MQIPYSKTSKTTKQLSKRIKPPNSHQKPRSQPDKNKRNLQHIHSTHRADPRISEPSILIQHLTADPVQSQFQDLPLRILHVFLPAQIRETAAPKPQFWVSAQTAQICGLH